MENQITSNVTDQSPTATNQNEPSRTPVLEQKTNGHVDIKVNDSEALADHVNGEAVGGDELAAEPGSGSEQVQVQKRRGRPKKHDGDGNFQPCESSTKKSRGRPRGSGRLQLLASGGFVAETAEGSFAPCFLTVPIGEDVMGMLESFSERSTQSVCTISATGAISSVVLALASGPTLAFEGPFEILYFSGAYAYTCGGIGGAQHKKGTFSVLLAKPDGNVFGGRVAGPMIAAVPIQLVVGSFKQNLSKQMRRKCQGEGCSSRKRPAGDPDTATTAKVLKPEPNIIEDEQKCASPTSGLVPITATSTINGVADNANQNMHPPAVALNCVGLETLDGGDLKPIIDQINGVQEI
ncbi:hypothetical protein L6164_022066 [Bauhinia variegata]|uniref:Uncharacterized protein n=1 Tax=Bauhinia variegata TaxID=167791 RepID=A0ACB9MDV7_BAUVA|nr:hypothetical protein L6164_022066 [Bauhinia variegata]